MWIIRHICKYFELLPVDELGYCNSIDLFERSKKSKDYAINNISDFLNIIEYLCDKNCHDKTRLLVIKENNLIIKIRSSE